MTPEQKRGLVSWLCFVLGLIGFFFFLIDQEAVRWDDLLKYPADTWKRIDRFYTRGLVTSLVFMAVGFGLILKWNGGRKQ